MERLKIEGLKITKLVIALLGLTSIAASCGHKTVAIHQIVGCGGEIEIDMAPGNLELIKAYKNAAEVSVNEEDQTITINGVTMAINENTTLSVGDVSKNHLKIVVQGDPDNDNRFNIRATSVCPQPNPTPQVTPQSRINKPQKHLLIHTPQKHLLIHTFYPGKASKPAFTGRRG